MTPAEARAAIIRVLAEIAPEAETTELRDDQPLQDQIEVDSMDLLNLMIGISETTGVDIPERDYPNVRTIGQTVDYLVVHAGKA